MLHQTCAGCVCAGSSEDSYILHMVHDALLLGYRSVGLNTLTWSYSMINALKCTVFNYITKVSISWWVKYEQLYIWCYTFYILPHLIT